MMGWSLLLWAGLAGAQAPAEQPEPAPEPSPGADPDTSPDPDALQLPELLEFVDAPWPPGAEEAGLEAEVRLELEIDATGRVVRAEVLEPAGQGFDEAAREAALQMRFRPARDASGPVPVVLEFSYGFELPERQAPPPVNLSGQLLTRGTRAPVARAAVSVQVGEREWTARSDEEGRFELRGVPAGEPSLRVVRPGYDELEQSVEVVEGERTELQLWLTARSTRDNEAVGLYRPEEVVSITRRSIRVEELRRVPGTFGDPVRVIQSLPGAARASFGTGLLVIRGANPEDTRVYVDGVEVPLIYHLGGYRSVINGAMISQVDYLPGGYDVRYGRGMGGVVDVRTQQEYPERFHLSWRTDLLDSSASMEGRVGDLGVAAGLRRSYLDLLIAPFVSDDLPTIKPRWYDYQAKVQSLSAGSDELSLFVFGFQDLLLIGNPPGFSEGQGEEGEDGLSAVYQTHRVVGSWRRELGEQASLRLQPAVGWDSVELGLGTDAAIASRFWRLGTRAELVWAPTPHLQLRPGLDASLYRYGTEFLLAGVSTDSDDPLAEGETFDFSDEGWTFAPDPYLDLQLRPLPDPDTWVLDLGVRATTEIVDDVAEAVADPRLLTRLALGERSWLKAGSGLYHQPPALQVAALSDPADFGFERAWATELGWEQGLGRAWSVDVTGFIKVLDGLIVSNPDLQSALTGELFADIGVGRVVGTELLLRKQPVGPLFGWISYTLSRSERNDAPERPELSEWYRYDFDQTHILTAVGGYTLPYDVDLSARLQYVTGNPYTALVGAEYDIDSGSYVPLRASERNGERLPPFYALDVRVGKVWSFRGWQLETFLDLLNLVHGVNPEALIYNYDYTEEAWILGLPTLPNLGVQADFWL